MRAETGERINLKAIPRDIPPHHQSVPKLLAAIVTKQTKYGRYAREITPIDLIINDTDQMLRFESVRELLAPIAFGEPFATIVESPFREIYLVTASTKKGVVCVPLRANLFAGDAAFFGGLFRDLIAKSGKQTMLSEYLKVFATFLAERFPTVSYCFDDHKMPRFIFGSVSWGYTREQSVEIVDISCEKKSDVKPLSADVDPNSLTNELRQLFQAQRANEFASFELCFDIATPHN